MQVRLWLALTPTVLGALFACTSRDETGGTTPSPSGGAGGMTASGGTGGNGTGGDDGGTSGSGGTTPVPTPWEPSATCRATASELVAEMTLDEKVGQMMQTDLATLQGGTGFPPAPSRLDDVATYFLGSVLSGGGAAPSSGNQASHWAALTDDLHTRSLSTRLGIPLLYGVDAVHGHNNVTGAVIFPHNIGLGATRDAALVEEAARVTALEVRGTGIDWTFAPALPAPIDERWGRTYEGFSEDPALVSLLGAAAIRGYQTNSLAGATAVLATAKHFAGDGVTEFGTGSKSDEFICDGHTALLDRGDSNIPEDEFWRLAVEPYVPAINAGVGSVMVSFTSYQGVKMHGSAEWITGVLKADVADGGLGFAGFVISDWEGHHELPGNFTAQVAATVNAGVDMIMEPYVYVEAIGALKGAVQGGQVSEARIDDAVSRILTIKCELGMFEEGYTGQTDTALTAQVGSAAHRAVAREAVQKSLVLLKNEGQVLPLSSSHHVHVLGSAANSLTKQCGGWTITWQGDGDTTTGTTILQAIQEQAAIVTSGASVDDAADVVVVAIGEDPYAEWCGDRSNLSLSAQDVSSIDAANASGKPVVVILVSGRPLIIEPHLEKAGAWIAAWLPGTEGAGIADVLFGSHAPTGKLSFSWPRTMSQIPINVGDADYETDPPLFAYGFGLTY